MNKMIVQNVWLFFYIICCSEMLFNLFVMWFSLVNYYC